MLESCLGNLLETDVEALVNTVNCVGVMGKGLALQFKQAFPENFQEYRRACQSGEAKPGQMFIVPTGQLANPRYIINFPTKRHWKNPSRIEDIETGLLALIETVKRFGIRSIAIPPLGCGNGGLAWSRVAPLIEAAFAQVPEVRVLIFEPPAAKSETVTASTSFPPFTRARALLIALMEQYLSLDYPLTTLEIQKLAYLLQSAGEPLRLQFIQGEQGPYAANLHPVLRQLEGHMIEGYRPDDEGAEIRLRPGVAQAAQDYLADTPATAILNRVTRLIEGYESPYSLEVLAIVHWVMQADPQAAASVERAIAAVEEWQLGQRKSFKPQHVKQAWQRLHEQRWLLTAEPV
ncbi:MAG: macro domain-containing protein [Stenomitos rutilans HA7619-LM2]|nr:macro domain-containing protein [Stenomitos rutilans HA7619-LM2]